jgi:hypothetical protein
MSEQYIPQDWPAWYYGPKGEAAIFEGGDDIPKGWTTTPKPPADEEEF